MLLTQYINKYTQQSVHYTNFQAEFEAFVDTNFPDNSTAVKAQMDWNKWVMTPGIPTDPLNFVTTNLTAAQALANEYIAKNGTGSPAEFAEYLTWDSNLKTIFLEKLAESNDTNLAIMT